MITTFDALTQVDERVADKIAKLKAYQRFMVSKISLLDEKMPEIVAFFKKHRIIVSGIKSVSMTGARGDENDLNEGSRLVVEFVATSKHFVNDGSRLVEKIRIEAMGLGLSVDVNPYSFAKDKRTDPEKGNNIITRIWL